MSKAILRGLPALLPLLLGAQSTQSLITGRIVNAESGAAIPAALVQWKYKSTGVGGASASGGGGRYVAAQLSPGLYHVRVAADGYQPQEIYDLAAPVAAVLEIDFRLRPLHDVWEQGAYRSVFMPDSRLMLNFFGPDVDRARSGSLESGQPRSQPLEATVSAVIDPALVENLPLAGRDIYTVLALLPGVTSDGGTARGLGLVANGQRPSSSNFFLDGIEFNNYLVTGPAAAIAPEAVQEYRVSLANYTAQYGGTTGLIANAVTRSGGGDFHGRAYGYLQNEVFNANEFQRNAARLGRAPAKWLQTGVQAGGPVSRQRKVFFSSSFDFASTRAQRVATPYRLATASLLEMAPAGSIARTLLTGHPSPALGISGDPTAWLTLAAPVTSDRYTTLHRLDWTPRDSRHRISGRAIVLRFDRPDFVWSPYAGLNTALENSVSNAAVTHLFAASPSLMNELKAGVGWDNLRWNRPDGAGPSLLSFDGTTLPGNPGLYSYKNATRSAQFLDNVVWTRDRHLLTFGAGYLQRNLTGYLTPGRDGEVYFAGAGDFAADIPLLYRTSSSAAALPTVEALDYDRQYRVREAFFFAQDTFRVSPRLTVNFGLRYVNFGSPANVGSTQDRMIRVGSGKTPAERVATAGFTTEGRTLYAGDGNNWEPRLGISYDVTGSGVTILRGGWGVFHDRVFDNLWQTARLNDVAYPQFVFGARAPVNYLAPPRSLLSQTELVAAVDPRVTIFDSALRNGRAQVYFGGIRRALTRDLSLDVYTSGAVGSGLITTDLVNRRIRPADSPVNPDLPVNLRFRSSQGKSDYRSLVASLQYRTRHASLGASYTWSHAIDLQSEAMESDAFDFRLIRTESTPPAPIGFSRQFDPQSDRGSSDFDQRHSLVFYSVWEAPAPRPSRWSTLLRNWRFAQLAAFRSGFPYSVFGNLGRVSILDPLNVTTNVPAPGGKILLNRTALADTAPEVYGNSGRNAFRGPGMYNVDVSVARAVALSWLGETGRLLFRVDAFNVLNHANLGTPNNYFSPFNPEFGVAAYGRKGIESAFPADAPFTENGRRIQVGLRVVF